MRKILTLSALAIALTLASPGILTVNLAVPSYVQAQAEVDFEQGSLNDEEYLRSIVAQFNELDTIESVSTSSGEGYETTSTMVMDLESGAAKIESIIPAVSDTSEDVSVLTYLFEDGSTAMDEVAYLESMSDIYTTMDPEFLTKLEQVKEQVAGRLVMMPPAEEAPDLTESELSQLFQIDDIDFIEVTKDGDIVRGVVDTDSYFETFADAQESLSMFPEGTVYTITYEVNPVEETLTSITNIDIPEEAAESESDLEGISVISMLSDSEVIVVSRATSEELPTVEEIDTLTSEEFDQILIEAGMENY